MTLYRSCLLLLASSKAVNALFEEDVGVLDWKLATTGHGPVEYAAVVPLSTDPPDYAQRLDSILITSDSRANPWLPVSSAISSTSCFVAGRNVSNGDVVWRRRVCQSMNHATLVSTYPARVLTITTTTASIWNAVTGALVSQVEYSNGESALPRIWTVVYQAAEYFAIWPSSSSSVILLDALTGQRVDSNVPSSRDAKAQIPAEPPATPMQATCPAADLIVTASSDGFTTQVGGYHQVHSMGEIPLVSPQDSVTAIKVLSCAKYAPVDAWSVQILLTTRRGTTAYVEVTVSQSLSLQLHFRAWEGLSSIQSAHLLETPNRFVTTAPALGSLTARWTLQYQAAVRTAQQLLSQSQGVFGFAKTAVLLSKVGAIYGLDTSAKGRVVYAIDLPVPAVWHRLVHGAPNSMHATHGYQAVTHSRDFLALSAVPDQTTLQTIYWICFDGATGEVSAKNSLAINSPVVQVIPLKGDAHCRQNALLVLQDRSIVSVLPVAVDATRILPSSHNGFYTHILRQQQDRNGSSGVETFRIVTKDPNQLVLQPVGVATFPGEQIVQVGYPLRDEIIQSPCHVVGDDSLLLKYLNPHLVVVMTMSNVQGEEALSELALTLQSAGSTGIGNSGGSKRKPVGVQEQASAPNSDPSIRPNLFVNVVDSVTGRVLYRAAHADAGLTPSPQVLVSENWIFYTYMNERTRRTELGVLSLYEGMINNKALTAFSKPEQRTTLSSLDARESTPVVLAKSFSLSIPVTALGITTTRSGISVRRLIMASASGQLSALDRKVVGKSCSPEKRIPFRS
jgi:ER membrane protein complex subunit 1, C-terminal